MKIEKFDNAKAKYYLGLIHYTGYVVE